MAITINIYYSGRNGSTRTFATEMKQCGVVECIRAEAGNLRYEYFFLMDDLETVLLIDSLADQAAIDVYHKSFMIQEIMCCGQAFL